MRLHLAAVLVLLAVLGGGADVSAFAEPISVDEYCRQVEVALRIECRGNAQLARAECYSDAAFDRWIDHPDADRDLAACLADVVTERTECYNLATCW